MVFHDSRSWRCREEVPRGFRERRSLERSLWGTSHLLSNANRHFIFGVLTETTGVCLQENSLWVADPKAINHILQKSGYLYAKASEVRERSALLTDRGILWADGELYIATRPLPTPNPSNSPTGDVHKRHRRAMAPAFGLVEAKGLLPHFMETANKVRELRLHLVSSADQGPPLSDDGQVG